MTTPPSEPGAGRVGLSAELARIMAGHLFVHAAMAGMRMAAPLLALRAGYGAVAVGLLLALFAVTQVFLSVPAGRYADRHGLHRPVIIAIALAVVGGGLAAAWPVFSVLCVSAMMTGCAAGLGSIALQRHVGRAASGPTQLRQVFSWLSIAPAVSNFVGPLVAGVLIDLGGFRAAFLAMALLPLGAWACVRGVRELPSADPRGAGRSAAAWDLLRDPGFRRLMIINWLVSSCWDVHTLVVPVLGHERGLSASVIGMILGAFAIAAAALRIVLPFLAARAPEWVVIMLSMGAAAVLFAVYPLMHSAWAMGVCSVLLGFALGAVQPMVMSTMHQITPAHRHGEALGIRMAAIYGSGVLMPLVFGLAGAVVGISAVFWTVGAMVGGGSRIAWRMRPREG